ncbi:MAG: site-2 protease family protein [Eubacteriales bacterium]
MISIIVLLIIIAILAFTFVVFIHELGHFLTAKWCGIRVNEFAIGMEIAHYKVGEERNKIFHTPVSDWRILCDGG